MKLIPFLQYRFDAELVALEVHVLHQKHLAEQAELEKARQAKAIALLAAKQESLKDGAAMSSETSKSAITNGPIVNAVSTSQFSDSQHNSISPKPESANPSIRAPFYNNPGEILKPQPLEKNTSSTNDAENASNKPSSVVLKEFEIDDSSPFDNVELQSIDDLKELNHIFQEMMKTNAKSSPDNCQSLSKENVTPESSSSSDLPKVATTAVAPLSTSENVSSVPEVVPPIYSSPYSQPSVQPIYHNNTYVNGVYHPPPAPPSIYPPAMPVPYSSYPQTGAINTANAVAFPSMSTYNTAFNYYTPLPPYRLPPPGSTSSATSLYNQPNQQSPFEMKRSTSEKKNLFIPPIVDNYAVHTNGAAQLRSSKSVSDLTNTSSNLANVTPVAAPSFDQHSGNSSFRHTMPYPSSLPPSIPVSSQPLHRQLESLPKHSHRSHHSHHTLGDPYQSLSIEERQFIDSLCSMGFQRDRISRAVKHIGIHDDKRIFEYLLSLQQLEDSGYDCYEAEIALHMNGYNKDKVRRVSLIFWAF